MIVALAGRRIDALDATAPHFPLANRDLVRQRLRDVFTDLGARVLVSSAACGGDLLALEIARALDVDRHIILPFGARRFRQRSVVDRPGDWGSLFDLIYREAVAQKQVTTLRGHGGGHGAYEVVTDAILERALAIARERDSRVTAVIVWDLSAWRPEDLTARFLVRAAARHVPVREIPTI